MARMLAGIPVLLNVDFLKMRNAFRPRYRTIFTGPIDEFFGFDMGRLAYRGQRRHHEFLPDVDRFQPVGQVNYPLKSQGDHVRVLEWKHMMEQPYGMRLRGTLLTRETPFSPDDRATMNIHFLTPLTSDSTPRTSNAPPRWATLCSAVASESIATTIWIKQSGGG
jgi:UDP-galactopyranose mutase